MIALPDVNVLIALAWPNHVHHDAARSWFAESRATGWATCPVTEAGFVRVGLPGFVWVRTTEARPWGSSGHGAGSRVDLPCACRWR